MHVAIIAEYNPFHNGHAYQIQKVREAFGEDTCITAILGGIFSQRGLPYIAPPYLRAEAAAKCGADLVLELPFPFSCAPAGIFARAGVEIAEKIGADHLAFGSESGDLETLYTGLARLESPEMQAALAAKKDGSISKTRLYHSVYTELYGEEPPCKPNDILALEYLRAIRTLGARIQPFTVRRVGSYKDGEGGFASASVLRAGYAERGADAFRGAMPDAAYDIFCNAEAQGLLFPDLDRLSAAIRLKFAEGKQNIAFAGGGLSGHVAKAIKASRTLSEFEAAAATPRFTFAEMLRCQLYTLLNVTADELDAPVRYTRVLAMGTRGRTVLAAPHAIEILTKPSAVQKLSGDAREQYVRSFFAEYAYALCLDGEYDHMKQTPRIIE